MLRSETNWKFTGRFDDGRKAHERNSRATE
jgi:hypothetical protein